MIKSAIGTEYAISTNQLDFLATERFNLRYIGEDGGEHPVYVIHRAPLGTHERFVAFLIEHYAGAFPTWSRRYRRG
jgi:threonyl-tRNA synthetase